ncbi:MAG TPA: LUD domain-containing protein [Chitinophagales bacterium]|nr:LUD domain-containing protein [Chitinophagales bacterium]HRP38625.1 LUD domain-containing protein [Chitinophagales bacterium]
MFTEEHGIFGRIKNLFGNGHAEKVTEVMGTRTVVGFDENEVPRPTSFADIINEPYSAAPPVTVRTVEPTAINYSKPKEIDLDIQFAENFCAQGGSFIYCETVADAMNILRDMKEQNQWKYVFAWENEICDIFTEQNFQRGAIGFTIKNSDAVISLCESLVAEDGSIIFNPKQASRRSLSCFPDIHIVLADATRLTTSLVSGVERFNQLHKPELPSVLKIDDETTGHFYDSARLVLRSEGTKNIFVIFVDEVIPPSIRP